MARIAIKNNAGRLRECEEADFPYFAASGFVKVVSEKKAEDKPLAKQTKSDSGDK